MLRDKFPDVPVMALTATATNRVRHDVLNNLRMPKAVVFTQSFNRPNLFYEVRKKSKKMMEEIVELSKRYPGQCGIVYCLSRMECENVASDLGVRW